MREKPIFGHLCAFFCVAVWGTTFLVSKVLLQSYTPVQVMLMRFVLAYAMLWIICPKWQFCGKGELGFLLMSLFSNTLYFLAENTAINYTQTSNVSILVSAAPVLTAVLFLLFCREERVTRNLAAGLAVAFGGMVLVVLNGTVVLKLSPLGDLLSLGAALCWAIYGLLLRGYTGRFSSALISRKLMFYGILTSLPLLLAEGTPFPLAALAKPQNLLGILFLGLVGSGVCYVCWNRAVEQLGVLRTNLYIYAIPFVTMLAGALAFRETVTGMAVVGAILIVAGMALSARKSKTQPEC